MKKYILLLLFCFCPSALSVQGGIITLGGDVTEIVFALGAGDRVIARDTTSEHPPQVTQLPGLAQTPAGKHQSVLIADDMGFLGFGLQTPETLRQLRKAMEATAAL